MSSSNKIQHNKKALLKALEKSMGIVSKACKIVDLDRSTFYKYYNEDEEFKNDVDNMQDYVLDFAESKLLENIKDKKETSIIFYLKTKGRKRGYIEKIEQDITTKGKEIGHTPVINFVKSDDD
jgi:ACT domain-containing protein